MLHKVFYCIDYQFCIFLIHVNKELTVFNLHIEICHRKLG